MRLYLVRHGQTPHNVTGSLDTAFPGAGLTPLGHSQACAVPPALAGLGEERVSGVYASPLVRTQLTATPLAEDKGLKIDVRDGLEEIGAGDLELRRDRDAVHAYAECVVQWMHRDLDHRLPGGSTGHEFLARYETALTAITERHEDDDTVVVFSHGAAIRVFTALATGLDPEAAVDLHIMNTGAGVLDGDPDRGWKLTRWSGDPLGGRELAGARAHDVTGESAEEVADED